MTARFLTALPVLACFLAASAGAQTPPAHVCGETPAAGQYVLCTASGDGDVDIDIDGVEIEPGTGSPGIEAYHSGTGDIEISVGDGSTIELSADGWHGIEANHIGTGDIEITVGDGSTIDTGIGGVGIRAGRGPDVPGAVSGAGRIAIDFGGGSSISARGAHGIYAFQAAKTAGGDIAIESNGGSITVDGASGKYGIYAAQQSSGDIVIDLSNFDILSKSKKVNPDSDPASHGITAWIYRDYAGDIDIDARGGSIETRGASSYGIYARHEGTGDIDVAIYRDHSIVTTGARASGITAGTSGGNVGDIDIDARAGSIETRGASSHGIHVVHEGTGDIDVATYRDHSIVTTGAGASGIRVVHQTPAKTDAISVVVGGRIAASGENGIGVVVGSVDADGNVSLAAPLGSGGFRQQTVTMNGSVTGNAAGVHLAGGGRVAIGPRGTVGATSGVAILASGDTPGENATDPVIKPKLGVDMNLDGRRVAEAIGGNWIVNDGGETTIAVNGIVLHDGEDGVTKKTVANGAWNVSMTGRPGVKITDRTGPDPANWITEDLAAGVTADRDFSAADFTEVYAPRAAVYEALPGFLLRLNAPGPSQMRIVSSDTPVWTRLRGGRGSYEADRASVCAQYDFNRFAVEAGLDLSLGETIAGSVSARHVRGSADIAAPTGGGKVEADGFGAALDLSASDENGYYARGGFSLTRYSLDVSSSGAGRLKSGVGAIGHRLDAEAGRRIAVDDETWLTPRTWLTRSEVHVDKFTDVVASRISVGDASRFAGGLGVLAEMKRSDALILRGSLDIEHAFSGNETRVDVSGERLSSESAGTRILLGLGGTYRWEGGRITAEALAEGIGSDDAAYGGQIAVGWNF